jgi:phosphoglycolate phosphatase/AHBA synthesis associated protein
VTAASRQLSAIIFDMDGTLLDSLAVQLESYRLAIVGCGGRDYSHDEILDSFKIGTAAIMLETLIGHRVGVQPVTRYEAQLRERADQVRPYPGVEAALNELATRFRLGVFTAADTNAAEILLTSAGIRRFFDVVIGADLPARSKPAPDGLLMACRGLGVLPTAAAYVGDGPSDSVVARACGALAVAAAWGHQFSADRDADIVAQIPEELLLALTASAP